MTNPEAVTRAADLLQSIGLEQLAAIERNAVAFALNGDTNEALHDFRVAVRRTRTAIGQMQSQLTPDERLYFAAEFKWLGRISSPSRDLDVLLEKLETSDDAVTTAAQTGSLPLIAYLQTMQTKEHQKLQSELRLSRFQTILKEWKEALLRLANGQYGTTTAEELAREGIRQRFKAMTSKAGAISADSADSDIHELRIAGKKLRYLLEFYTPVFEGGQIETLIEDLKIFQDSLGLFQDLVIQAQLLAGVVADSDGPAADGARKWQPLLAGQKATMRSAVIAEASSFVNPETARQFEQFLGTG